MRQIRSCLFTCATIALIATNLAASSTPTCNASGSDPRVCWRDPQPGAQAYPACPTTQCGYYYMTPGGGWNIFPTTMANPYGSHSWNGTSNLSTFLNGLYPNLNFSLTSNAYMYECPQSVCANRTQYVNPSQDYGYFLSTANSTNAPGITITFPSPGIKSFAFLWGSVDQWNTITFHTANGSYSVSGDGLPQFTAYNIVGGTSTTSELVKFELQSNSDPAWTSVTFSSCSSNATICGPAFEFDDIEWVTACPNCPTVTLNSPIPSPEPGSLMLLGSGLTGAIWRRRRRNPR